MIQAHGSFFGLRDSRRRPQSSPSTRRTEPKIPQIIPAWVIWAVKVGEAADRDDDFSADLGLDGLGWASDIGAFNAPDDDGEPDLFFLAVHQHQPVSLQRWDALLQRGPEHLKTLRQEVAVWLEEHEYESLNQMHGSMNMSRVPNPDKLTRANYMKMLDSWQQ